MSDAIKREDFSYVDRSSQIGKTIEEDTTRFAALSKSSLLSGYDDSASAAQITDDDEKSAIFQEFLFQNVAKKVLERNRELFEELSRY